MKKPSLLLYLILLIGCSYQKKHEIVKLVNPFIGTDGHGHTYPGATVPFGMVQLSPDTRKDDWDACSGYHYSDSTIMGFSHTHLSGTGVGDYGDVRFMPMTGSLQIRPGKNNDTNTGYRSKFSHDQEEATPGYYNVLLSDYGIRAEMTTTSRCGFQRYTFPESQESDILIDLSASVVTEKNPELSINIINDHEISGLRRSSGWANDQFIYFYAIFSKPFESFGIAVDGVISENLQQAEGNDIQAFVKYKTSRNEKILVKVGLSSVSTEGARKNLEDEIPGWNFNKIHKQAEAAWVKELGKIVVKGGTRNDRIKFYSALYHCYLVPNLFSDVDGMYRGHDGKIHQASGFNIYTVFSLWDTYRAWHPLMTILEPERTVDFIKTFLDIDEKDGLLPVWELAGNETNCMIGYHAVPVIADAWIKGIDGFDKEKAFEAMRKSAMQDQFGLKYYKKYGFIPAESEGEAVSKTLEYAYDDWCIAQVAERLDRPDDYSYFIQRAQYYKNLYDPQTGFLRGKRNGMFVEPFDPSEVNFMLTEANTWQYTFYVPQDINGLIKLMGGEKVFERKLNEMFTAPTALKGRQQADITGLIGQYAQGNEPSHHMAYLYNYIGVPFKTQRLVRQIMDDLYGPGPDGLCGNEDCGQMSAWFVFSAMGFYPVTPGIGYYTIGSPLFEQVTIHLDNGEKFIIKADDNNSSNIYIQSATLNGKDYSKSYLSHKDIIEGGMLELSMGSLGDSKWGTKASDRPVSAITEDLVTPVPFFIAPSNTFQKDMYVKISDAYSDAKIYYQTGKDPNISTFRPYNDSIYAYNSFYLSAYASVDTLVQSKIVNASFHKIPHNWQVTIKNPYSSQYSGGGDLALIDGQYGGENFRTGSWQGYHGSDFEAVIDMGKPRSIRKITATFLQDQRSWIFMPEMVDFAVSLKPYDFRTVALIENDVPDTLSDPIIKQFIKEGMKESGRYVRVKATNRKTCPDWHVGAGEKAWIFIDEITVE